VGILPVNHRDKTANIDDTECRVHHLHEAVKPHNVTVSLI